MKKYIDPFIDFLPSLDLHGEDRINSIILVKEFINDNLKLRNKKIVIIHGIGTGVLKTEVYRYLKNNKNVLTYKQYYNNLGCTIVDLK